MRPVTSAETRGDQSSRHATANARAQLRVRTTVAAPYDETVERTRSALKEQGFGILTEIDVKRTMKEKLDLEFRPYVILGACKPPLPHKALSADLGVGLLLPCNVVVYDNQDGSSRVEAMDPEPALGIVGDDPVFAAVAREAGTLLRKAVDALAKRDARRQQRAP